MQATSPFDAGELKPTASSKTIESTDDTELEICVQAADAGGVSMPSAVLATNYGGGLATEGDGARSRVCTGCARLTLRSSQFQRLGGEQQGANCASAQAAPAMPEGGGTGAEIGNRPRRPPSASNRKRSDFDYLVPGDVSRRAVALDPSNAETLYQLADVTCSQGRLDDGIAMMRKALTMEPLNASFHFYTGNFLLSVGRFDEAQAELEKAIELQPGAEGYGAVLGSALMERGQFDQALAAARADPTAQRRCDDDLVVQGRQGAVQHSGRNDPARRRNLAGRDRRGLCFCWRHRRGVHPLARSKARMQRRISAASIVRVDIAAAGSALHRSARRSDCPILPRCGLRG